LTGATPEAIFLNMPLRFSLSIMETSSVLGIKCGISTNTRKKIYREICLEKTKSTFFVHTQQRSEPDG